MPSFARFSLPLLAVAAIAAAGCAHRGHQGPQATAALAPSSGSQVRGQVMFHAHGDHVMVHARVSGLKPGQQHGFHLHEKGDCSAADATSAGGHFDPTKMPHGPQNGPRHAGDMPSLQADAQGNADAHFTLHGVTIGSGVTNIVGRGVIVHAQPDDYATQPTGNSGARIACGVVVAR